MLHIYKKHSKLLTELGNLFIVHCFYCCEHFVERSCSNLQGGQPLGCVYTKLWSNPECCFCAPLNWNIIRWACKILLCHSIGVPKHARKLWFRMCETQLQIYLLFYFSCNKKWNMYFVYFLIVVQCYRTVGISSVFFKDL